MITLAVQNGRSSRSDPYDRSIRSSQSSRSETFFPTYLLVSCINSTDHFGIMLSTQCVINGFYLAPGVHILHSRANGQCAVATSPRYAWWFGISGFYNRRITSLIQICNWYIACKQQHEGIAICFSRLNNTRDVKRFPLIILSATGSCLVFDKINSIHTKFKLINKRISSFFV